MKKEIRELMDKKTLTRDEQTYLNYLLTMLAGGEK